MGCRRLTTRGVGQIGHETTYNVDASGRLHAVRLGPDPNRMRWTTAALHGARRARLGAAATTPANPRDV